MNLLWSMARYIHGLDGNTKEILIGMIVEQLKLNAGILSKTKNQRHIFHFLPNLVWSLDTLGVDDPLLWSALIKDIEIFSESFTLKELASIVSPLITLNTHESR